MTKDDRSDGSVLSEGLGAGAEAPCTCHGCVRAADIRWNGLRLDFAMMIVCPDCGNKRCPKANDHRHACTGSNEPGQPGSAYPGPAMCPHCGHSAPGWTLDDVQRGWRMRPGLKEYHCRHAAVAD
jgi:hypothetical protein